MVVMVMVMVMVMMVVMVVMVVMVAAVMVGVTVAPTPRTGLAGIDNRPEMSIPIVAPPGPTAGGAGRQRP